MEIPIWLIAIATAWKLAIETATIISNHRIEMKRLELEAKKPENPER